MFTTLGYVLDVAELQKVEKVAVAASKYKDDRGAYVVLDYQHGTFRVGATDQLTGEHFIAGVRLAPGRWPTGASVDDRFVLLDPTKLLPCVRAMIALLRGKGAATVTLSISKAFESKDDRHAKGYVLSPLPFAALDEQGDVVAVTVCMPMRADTTRPRDTLRGAV
jgi:hypothetical protein